MDPVLLLRRIEKLNEIGIALSAEKDKSRLLAQILEAAKELTGADAGTLYSVTPEKMLRFEIIRNDTLKFAWARGDLNMLFPTEDIALFNDKFQPNDQMVVVYAVTHDKAVNIPDAYDAAGFDFSGTRKFDQKSGYRSQSLLTVPLKNHEGEIIAILQLINAKDPATGVIVPFSEMDQYLVESLSSQAAVALTNQALIEGLLKMFEAFVKVLADAIDEKSPVTGRHCKRVPVIAMELARAINEDRQGRFKETQLNHDELYELEIAALLHDCGKIVTPVNVVEKATKLEGIWDRIELVDMRLEALKQKERADALEAICSADPALKGKIAAIRDREKDIEELKNFLHDCNRGRELMPAEWLERLKEIAKKRDGENNPLLSSEELHKLLVAHGTLTDEERKVIENHVSMTIKMLTPIPYPKNLRHVPEIAGSHHERMDGKGYPKGLTRFQMSLRARILAIADIFEALTAPDRPYKQPMPLSKALAIMEDLKKEGHIDPDLWDLFVRSKAYLKYGKEHLSPQQVDLD